MPRFHAPGSPSLRLTQPANGITIAFADGYYETENKAEIAALEAIPEVELVEPAQPEPEQPVAPAPPDAPSATSTATWTTD